MKRIVTHNGVFHIDEVAAIALLIVFGYVSEDIKIIRTRDKDIIFDSSCHGDYVIDVGGKYNGITLFDHHQDASFTKSSAGLVWQMIEMEDKYPNISKLITIIDKQDLGIEQAGEFTLVGEFKRLNGNPANNEDNFKFAIKYMTNILFSMKREIESLVEAEKIVRNSTIKNNIMYLEKFNRGWTTFVNGQTEFSHIKYVVWFDLIQNKYLVQVPPLKEGSFELNGEKLKPCKTMEFVHATGFMAVADTLEILDEYLANN